MSIIFSGPSTFSGIPELKSIFLNIILTVYQFKESSNEIIASDPITTNLCSLNGCNQLTKICPFIPFSYSN